MLNDGKWHSLDEIRNKTKVRGNHVQRVVDFLQEYNLVVIDDVNQKIKLSKTTKEFLMQLSTIVEEK